MSFEVFTPEYYMNEALKQAKLAFESGEVPIGAVVVCGERIVAKSHNQVELLRDPTAHAEMLALTAATDYMGGKYLDECDLYVTIEPCVMCAGACYWAQLQSVTYGANDPKRGYSAHGKHLFHPQTTVNTGVLASECGQILKDFFSRLRD